MPSDASFEDDLDADEFDKAELISLFTDDVRQVLARPPEPREVTVLASGGTCPGLAWTFVAPSSGRLSELKAPPARMPAERWHIARPLSPQDAGGCRATRRPEGPQKTSQPMSGLHKISPHEAGVELACRDCGL